ncbi:MAG: hypothetical protein IJO48_05090, partial [Clostridia bacterium]|nr:hypothetical protein [Clostridia bacterium]
MKRMKQLIALLTVVCMMASIVTLYASADLDREPGESKIVIGNIDSEATEVILNFENGSLTCTKEEGNDAWWYSWAQRWSEPDYWVCIDDQDLYERFNVTSVTVKWADGTSAEIGPDGYIAQKSTLISMFIFLAIRDEFKPKPTATPTIPATTAPATTAPATTAPATTAPATTAPATTAPATTAPAETATPTVLPT